MLPFVGSRFMIWTTVSITKGKSRSEILYAIIIVGGEGAGGYRVRALRKEGGGRKTCPLGVKTEGVAPGGED